MMNVTTWALLNDKSKGLSHSSDKGVCDAFRGTGT